MLPDFLDSSYRRYKHDTAKFIKWLSETAEKCGYTTVSPQSGLAPDKAAAPPTRRLKGKARIEAKRAEMEAMRAAIAQGKPVSQQVPPIASPTLKHVVALKDLLPQARAIASNTKMAIQVPSSIIRVGLRAVSARKRCAAWFKKQFSDDPRESQSNNQHSYFIDLLQEVLLTLSPHDESLAASKAPGSEPQSLPDNLTSSKSVNYGPLENMFGLLDVEDVQEQDFSEPIRATTSPLGGKPSPEKVYELESSTAVGDAADDALFAIFCLLDDLHRIRGSILQLWSDYRERKVDLITASVTTNTALELAQRAEEDFLASYPACRGYDETLKVILENVRRFQDPKGLSDEVELEENMAEWIFTPSHNLLDSFCDVLHVNEVPVMKRGHFGVYNPRADRSNMAAPQRYREDLIILMEIMPEF